jgi:hypothetical protein
MFLKILSFLMGITKIELPLTYPRTVLLIAVVVGGWMCVTTCKCYDIVSVEIQCTCCVSRTAVPPQADRDDIAVNMSCTEQVFLLSQASLRYATVVTDRRSALYHK